MLRRCQQTLRQSVAIEGRGLFFGQPVTMILQPGAIDSGLIFERTDLAPGLPIPACITSLQQVPRRTSLGGELARVEMVEHLLAALAGMQIDNCRILLHGPEPPNGDGSARHLVQAIQQAGSIMQPAEVPVVAVLQPIRVESLDGRAWLDLLPVEPSEGDDPPRCIWEYELDYGNGPLPRQTAMWDRSPALFAQELAAMRTFVFQGEIEQLQALGLGRDATASDLLVLQQDGTPLETSLRASNECARHKLLDVVGDLALLGCDLWASIRAYRSGHDLNHQAVKALLQGLTDGRCCWLGSMHQNAQEQAA